MTRRRCGTNSPSAHHAIDKTPHESGIAGRAPANAADGRESIRKAVEAPVRAGRGYPGAGWSPQLARIAAGKRHRVTGMALSHPVGLRFESG